MMVSGDDSIKLLYPYKLKHIIQHNYFARTTTCSVVNRGGGGIHASC